MSERDLDRLLYDLLEGDLDREHGQHILDVVAAYEERRRGRAEDPILEVLRRAHHAEVEKVEQE